MFDMMEQMLSDLIYCRHYTAEQIQEYLLFGGLPNLIRQTYEHFRMLVNLIKAKSSKVDIWEDGPAKAMLDFHSRKLLYMREKSVS